ncbi:Phytoene/squalene synthetase (ERG9) (PDB:3WEK) [Commensalibacter communis]|uniref:squalene synthase HpnC n=1 Tax=Commensalibacter communis TaxID=2972786 RepID=UPI0022FF5213|nr:squalene synthase HpnC [Commensalibacter communis]CAI3938339.1 Phytoene/squalene synthetase (ERG9) (PDB:3WEK) [Commensalibacter communis]
MMASQPSKSTLYDSSVWGEEDVSSGKAAKDENFPVGSLLISRQLRPHVQAYYDFARVIDDIADSETLTPEEKINRLNGMEAVLCKDVPAPDRSDVWTARRLHNSFIEKGVSFDTATDLIIAFRQDAVKTRYKTLDELVNYCRYSANPVGHFLLKLHKEGPDTIPASDALCTSLQILNHLQDCKTDLIKLDRCYIPSDLMQEYQVTIDDILADKTSFPLRKIFNRLLDYIDALNKEAEDLPRLTRDRRLRLESAVIVYLAKFLTQRLRTEDPLAGRVKLSKKDVLCSTLKSFRHFM